MKDQCDDSIKYLTSPENLPYTLEILQQSEEIYNEVLGHFWQSVKESLLHSVPKALRSQSLAWTLWPGPGKMGQNYAGVWCCVSKCRNQEEVLSYVVRHYLHSALIEIDLGLMWEKAQPANSGFLKLPAVRRLKDMLVERTPNHSQWWLGRSTLYRDEQTGEFLLQYARNPERIHLRIQESFWPFVQDSFELMAKANEAIRRAI